MPSTRSKSKRNSQDTIHDNSSQEVGQVDHQTVSNEIEERDNVIIFTFPENALILPGARNSYINLTKKNSGYIYTDDNYKKYRQIVNLSLSLKYYNSSNKKNFLIEFIDEIFETYLVYKFNDEEKKYMTIDKIEFYGILEKRLQSLKGHVKYNVKKGLCKSPLVSSKRTFSSNDISNDSYPFKFTHDNEDAVQVSKLYKSLYHNSSLLKGHDSWNFFSMFHSVYQSFSTVVYNSSHKRIDNGTVHRLSRSQLNFPQNANCLLLIHGRLVHSGSKSKKENKMSFNTSHDVRLFAYLSTLSSRSEHNTLYEQHLEPDTVDTSTFELCRDNCLICRERSKLIKKDNIEHEQINIQDYIDAEELLQKNQRTTHLQPKSHKLLGDMDELGWEVWTGLDTSLPKYTDLQTHLSTFVHGRGKTLWSGISSTKRKALKIDQLLGEQTSNIHDSLVYMTTIFDDIKEHVLEHIPHLGTNTTVGPRVILANFGELNEQMPHRDFSSKKR
jgi:hypothetical protein